MRAVRDQPHRPNEKPSTRPFTNGTDGLEMAKMSVFSSAGKKAPVNSGASLVCVASVGCVIPPSRWEEKTWFILHEFAMIHASAAKVQPFVERGCN